MTPETLSRINMWRAKCVDGTITPDELQQAMAALRGERKASAVATSSSKARVTKAKAVIPSADDLLKEMGMLDEATSDDTDDDSSSDE